MDAAGYLSRHGWRGSGHSLDNSNRGLKRPLLISHKQDSLGVGKKKNLVSDQWWMRAFDESLKELGTGKKTTLQQVSAMGINRGGLYSFFVKGTGLEGTIGDVEEIPSTYGRTQELNSGIGSSRSSSGVSTPANVSSNLEAKQLKSKKEKYVRRLIKLQQKLVRKDAKISELSVDKQAKKMKLVKPDTLNADQAQAEIQKLKTLMAQAAKAGTTVHEQVAKRSAAEGTCMKTIDATKKPVHQEKLTVYKLRAAEKGLPLEDYMKRRAEKRLEKKERKP